MFKLRLAHANISAKKQSCKRDLIGPNDPSSSKIIFVLLAKVITIYVLG